MATYYVDAATGDDVDDGLSEANAWATVDKAMNSVAAGDLVHVKGGTDYTETATLDTAGTATAPIIFAGYSSTPGDNPTGASRATIDASGLANALATIIGSGTLVFYVFKNCIFKNSTSRLVDLGSNKNIAFKNCRFTNAGGLDGCRVGNSLVIEDCESDSNADEGFEGGAYCSGVGCYSHGNGDDGFAMSTGSCCAFCVSLSNAGDSFNMGGDLSSFVINCTVDGDAKDTTIGVNFPHATLLSAMIINTIIYDCVTGMSMGRDLGEFVISRNNLVNANTDNYSNAATHSGEQTGAPLFTTEGSDYSVQSGSPAKAAGVDAGTIAGTGAEYCDIGAVQREEAGGGGGGVVRRIPKIYGSS